MKKHTIISALSAFALVAAAVSQPLTINAESTYTKAGKAVTFASYLRMDTDASVPAETFTYTIAPYGDTAVGYMSSTKTTGTPTIGTAVFTQNQDTYSSVQTLDPTINIQKQTNGTTNDNDGLTITSTQKYARASVTVDFSKVVFNDPGVYYYVITEDKGTDEAVDYDTKPSIMEVYASYSTDTSGNTILNIDGYVMYQSKKVVTTENGTTTTTYVIDKTTKADGFVNDYETENLTISKTVSGNQASHDEYFEFDVKLIGEKPLSTYAVDISNAESSTKVNGATNIAHTNVNTITLSSQGVATETFWLKHKQSIIIKGLPRGTEYYVNEDYKKVVTTEGYTPSVETTGDNIAGGVNKITSGTYTGKDTAGTNTNTLTLNADNSATLVYENSADTAKNKTIEGSWSQSSYNVTFYTKIGTETFSSVYSLSIDGKTLTSVGTPTINTASGFENVIITSPITSTDAVIVASAKTTAALTLDDATATLHDTYLSADTTAAFKNTKEGSIPTGIIMNTAPYAVVVLFGFAGLLIFVKKKKEDEAEEY